MRPADDDPVTRARALQPLVRQYADASQHDRHLHADVARAIANAGLYRLAVPKACGGPEADPTTQIRTIEAIAEADGSAAWNLMIGIESLGLVAPLFGAARNEVLADPLTILCSSTAAVGSATPTDGGYRIAGRWGFVSGCHNAQWFAATVRVPTGGEGESRQAYALLPKAEFEIVDTWHVAGLRGSGSHDVVVDDVLVPNARMSGHLGTARHDSPLLRLPLGSRLAYNKVGVGFGIARAAIDTFVDLATAKVPRFSSRSVRERPFAQRSVALAEIRLRAARALVFELTDALWHTALAGKAFDDRVRALHQAACCDAAVACVDAVEHVLEAAGTSANELANPLERHARDVRVIRQHVTVAPHHVEDAGRVLLGLPAEGLMLRSL